MTRRIPTTSPEIPDRGNRHLAKKMEAIQASLMARHGGGKGSSASSKGRDRERFVEKFLKGVLPTPFRFGHGEITDRAGRISGQIDIVIEYPLWPSVQVEEDSSRLYLAEGVACAIEVKSNLIKQWKEVEESARKLRLLHRRFQDGSYSAPGFVPLFVVGYTGWKTWDKPQELVKQGLVDGILIIDEGIFCWNRRVLSMVEMTHDALKGPLALWAFITCLCTFAHSVTRTSVSPFIYVRPELILLGWALHHEKQQGDRVSIAGIAQSAQFDLAETKIQIKILEGIGLIAADGDSFVITEAGRKELASMLSMVPL